MKKQIIILIMTTILIVAIAAAAQQSFGDAVTSGNLLYINTGGKHRTSAIVGWYPVEDWEVETCTRDVSSSFKIDSQSDSGVFSANNLIIDTTLTMQAFKQDFEFGQGLKEYEVSWYVQPLNKSISYEIQYFSTDWRSLDPPVQREAGAVNGDMGYQTWSSDQNISKMRIITSDGNSLEIPVVEQ